MKGYERARTRRLAQALNYVLGYLAALEAYAQTPEQRASAASLRTEIYGWMTPPPPKQYEREQDE